MDIAIPTLSLLWSLTAAAVGLHVLARAGKSSPAQTSFLSRSRTFRAIATALGTNPPLAATACALALLFLPLVFTLLRGPGTGLVLFVALLLAIVFSRLFLDPYNRRRRVLKFEEQMPEVLDQLVSAVRGSKTLQQGLLEIVPLLDEPARTEIRELAETARLGAGGLRQAIVESEAKFNSRNYSLILSIFSVFSQRGGNLVEPIQKISASFKEIFRLDQKIRSASASARAASVLIHLVMLFLFLFISAVRPDMITEIFLSRLGIAQFLVGIAVYCCGVYWMQQMMRIEV